MLLLLNDIDAVPDSSCDALSDAESDLVCCDETERLVSDGVFGLPLAVMVRVCVRDVC